MNIEDMLIRHEGLKLKPYKCTAGKLTIGVGRNLEDKGLTRDEALYLLSNDVKECVSDLSRILKCWESLSEARQMALISMRFNLGSRGFRSFKKMIAAIEAGDFQEARAQMIDSRWWNQVGDRSREIGKMILVG